MFELDVPGFGLIPLNYLVSDFTGTLSVDGRLIEGVQDRLNKIGEFLEIHFLTADVQVHSILDGLDLLLHPKRCKATLRF